MEKQMPFDGRNIFLRRQRRDEIGYRLRNRAHGVVVSRLLRMQKALGSNPSGSIPFANLNAVFRLRNQNAYAQSFHTGSVSEWLRSRTRNPMGSARGGSNPLAVAFLKRDKRTSRDHSESEMGWQQ